MPTILHPMWLLAGIILCLIGILLIRWAIRNTMSAAIRDATVDTVLNTVAKGSRSEPADALKAKISQAASSQSAGAKGGVGRYSLRKSLSQLSGAIGFIMLMAGLVTCVLGIAGT